MASFKAKFPVLQELFAKNHRGLFGPPPPSGARVNITLKRVWPNNHFFLIAEAFIVHASTYSFGPSKSDVTAVTPEIILVGHWVLAVGPRLTLQSNTESPRARSDRLSLRNPAKPAGAIWYRSCVKWNCRAAVTNRTVPPKPGEHFGMRLAMPAGSALSDRVNNRPFPMSIDNCTDID